MTLNPEAIMIPRIELLRAEDNDPSSDSADRAI
jgi:hypothetical protein